LPVETTTAAREFARRFNNTLIELQLQTGIHRRIENLVSDWAEQHANLRASFFSREVDESYFQNPDLPAEAITRPKLHALAIEGDHLYEFFAFAHGFRRDVVSLHSIVNIQELWLEPKAEEPFTYRVLLIHNFGSQTVLLATTGEGQDAAQEFIGRLKYLRGW
jgi:hypothetical protein